MHVCVSRTIPRSRGPGPPGTARVTRCSGHAALPGGREAGRGPPVARALPALVLCSLSSGRCYGRDVAAALIPFPSWMTTASVLSHSPLPGRLSLRPAEPWTSSSASPGTEVPGRGPRPLILGLSLPILPNTNLPLRPIRVWKLGTNSASCVGTATGCSVAGAVMRRHREATRRKGTSGQTCRSQRPALREEAPWAGRPLHDGVTDAGLGLSWRWRACPGRLAGEGGCGRRSLLFSTRRSPCQIALA